MYISLNWIKDFVDIPEKYSAEELGDLLTLHTAEVEGVENQEESYQNMVIGKVTSLTKHPDADKLNIAQVNIGTETVQIVCGGQNLAVDMLVAMALPGAFVRWHGEGDLVQLTEAKIRGEKSFGMICAGEEIGMEADNTADSKEVRIKDLSDLKLAPGTPLAQALGRNDTILDIDNKSLTHRPDLWGHYGMAREFACLTGQKLKALELEYKAGSAEVKPSAKIQDDDICPRFSMAVMKGITIAESPLWMRARLEAAGMSAHNNIVDITNYVMLELGQPMHAYDRSVVGSDQLIVRRAKDGEVLVALDESEYKLSSDDPIVCNEKNEALGIAGIKGGFKSGISGETAEIILEAANWDPIVVRKCSTKIGLRTDASQRFEKGLDPSMTEAAIKRAIQLVQELCPDAELISNIVTTGTWIPKTVTLKLQVDSINRKIGMEIPQAEMVRILNALEFQVEEDGELLIVTAPLHRVTGDVDIEEDIVEEIARINGYDKIPAQLPSLPTKLPEENPERILKHKTRRIFAHQLGFTEVQNYSFYGKDRMEQAYLPEEGHIQVLNYLSEDQTHMRTSMVPNILANIAANSRERKWMQIFEIGRTYKEDGDYMPLEQKKLCVAVAQAEGESFYNLRGALEKYLELFGSGSAKLPASENPPVYAHPSKCVDVLVRGKKIGHLFGVHPGVLKNYDIDHNVAMLELNFNELVAQGQSISSFKHLPKFPEISFDVSTLVDERTISALCESTIKKAASKEILESVELFDTYTGKHIEDGKKALSFRVDLRHSERTLTDAELHETQEAIFLALEGIGATIRGR